MSIWILHQTLTPEEEDTIGQRSHVLFPLEGLPDLSQVKTPQGYMSMLREMHPDMPPESVSQLMNKNWKFFHDVHMEDIIGVPLQARKEIALAEVTGNYEYERGQHLLPVKWHDKRIPFRRLKKIPNLLEPYHGRRAYEVEDAQARIIIRDRMPHSYNRFVKFKWLLLLFFAWRLLVHMRHMGSTFGWDVIP